MDEDEFARWVRPADAVRQLDRLGEYQAVQEIYLRLKDNLLTAVAELAVTRENTITFATLRADIWARTSAEHRDAAFWKTGTLEIQSPSSSYSFSPTRCYDVRFDPDQFSKHVRTLVGGPPAAHAPVQAADGRKPLALADQKRFATLYIDVFGDSGTERGAYSAVMAMYPDRKIPRDPFLEEFRAIRGRQVPGRKPKTDNHQ